MLSELSQSWTHLSGLLSHPLHISLPSTSRMSACHTLFREQSKSPSGRQIIKNQCYESWHLMNNYFKNLFLSVPSTPDGWVGSVKLLHQTMMRTSLKQGATCPFFIYFWKYIDSKVILWVCGRKRIRQITLAVKQADLGLLWELLGPISLPVSQKCLLVSGFCCRDGQWQTVMLDVNRIQLYTHCNFAMEEFERRVRTQLPQTLSELQFHCLWEPGVCAGQVVSGGGVWARALPCRCCPPGWPPAGPPSSKSTRMMLALKERYALICWILTAPFSAGAVWG